MNLFLLFTVPTGYIITYNATEYEFDVNVYSPVETVVFEALLITENITFFTISIEFMGNSSQYSPYSINRMGNQIRFDVPTPTNPLLMIRLDETLNSTDEQVDYEFTLYYVAIHVDGRAEDTVNVILHEIGKLNHIQKYPGCKKIVRPIRSSIVAIVTDDQNL